ncbi:hypothetical protein D3C72_1530920 [compost metagenome]
MLIVCWQFCSFLLEEGHRLAQGNVRGRDRHQGGAVELIELGQCVGLDTSFQGDHRGNGHLPPAGRANVVAFEKLWCQALVPWGLWNDIVGTTLSTKTVDIGLTDQAGKGVADFLHVQAQVMGFGAVDAHQYCGVGEGQVGVDEGKQPTVASGSFDLLHVFIDFFMLGRRSHHQLYRKTAHRAWQRCRQKG